MDENVFAQDEKGYIVYKDGNNFPIQSLDNAEEFVNYINDDPFDKNESYTIKMFSDLEIPLEGSKLKTINLNGDITIEGNGHKITGADGGEQGDRFINIIDGNINIKNLNFNGSGNYAGILSDNTDAIRRPSLKISDCNFTNLNTKSYDELQCNMGGPAISVANTNIEATRVNVSNSGRKDFGGGVFIEVSDDDLSDGTYVLQECNFTNCKAGAGGAVWLSSRGDNNQWIPKPPKMYLKRKMKGTIYLRKCTIDSCRAANGSAIGIGDFIKVEITNSTIKNCEAYGSRGGTILKEADDRNFDANQEDVIIKDCIIDACTARSGAAMYFYYVNVLIENTTIKNCSSLDDDSKGAGTLYLDCCKAKITRSTFDSNKAQTSGGAISITGYATTTIEGCKFIKNECINGSGGAIYSHSYELDIKDTIISNNKANVYDPKVYDSEPRESFGYGAGLYLSYYTDESKVTIDGGEITNNSAAQFGGGIYVFDKYDDTELGDKNKKLIIKDNVKFGGNTADYGYYNPPENYKEYNNFTHDTHSRPKRIVVKEGEEYKYVDSLLNNYDINYINKKTTTIYDPNGGQGKLFVEEINTPYKEEEGEEASVDYHTIKVKDLKETNISNGKKVLFGWSTEPDGKGIILKPGQEHTLKGNLYLYAIWKEPQKFITLTLDENYKGGKITDNEVMVGDTMDPYLYKPKRRGFTFKGWSYNKKHLDKVHYDDRIYEDTTVYAIWDEVEEEPEEIKGQEHKAYIFGYPDGTVRPNGEITRAEAAALLARLLEIESIGSAEAPSFPDTPSAWYNKAINAVVQRGIMKGYPDGTFKPNDAITRAEFTQMIWAIDNKPYGTAPFADVVGHWAERPIGSEYQAGRILGYPDGTFRPDAHITRCEAAVILNKIFERNFDNMSLIKCKNPMMIKYFIDLDASFWGYNDMVEATNTHEYVRRNTNRVEENWLLVK